MAATQASFQNLDQNTSFGDAGDWAEQGHQQAANASFEDPSGPQCFTFKAHDAPITDIQVTSDDMIFTASQDNKIKIWKLEEDNYVLKKTLNGHSHVVSELAFGSSSTNQVSHFVSSSYDRTINLWDTNRLDAPTRIKGHEKAVLSVAMSADNRVIVSGGADKKVKVWNVTGQNKIEDSSHKDFVNRVAFNPCFHTIFFSCSEDRSLIGYNFEDQRTLQPYANITGPQGPILNFDISPDGSLCALVSQREIYYCDLVMGDHCANERLPSVQKLANNKTQVSSGSCLKFNPEAILVAYSCGANIYLRVLNTNSKRTLNINDGEQSNHRSSAVFTRFNWNKQGNSLITAATDGKVRIYKCNEMLQ